MNPISDAPSSGLISSLANPRVKRVVKLRQRAHRDELALLLIEGFREVRRAMSARHPIVELYYCRALFQGENEDTLLAAARERGVELVPCTDEVFRKMSYRDRPDGLIALGAPAGVALDRLSLSATPFLMIAESIEKPGNLGTLLRTADGAGVEAVIVCDRCTDINNPNVVRASIGTLFTVPVAEASTPEAIRWLRTKGIAIIAGSPHGAKRFTDADMTQPVAIVVGSEQYGISSAWMDIADERVRIPMLGAVDSLNVTAAATLLLYETVRQRINAGMARDGDAGRVEE